jgi:hypothetical protein
MADVEINIEGSDDCCDCACCKNCPDCGTSGPVESKDALLAKLKDLLSKTDANGQAQRQLDIDKLISQIEDLTPED